MARRRKAKSRKRRSFEPEDVLEGRVEIPPEEFFDLVHRVNPTGRELSLAEQERRYGLKHRLQSLLVRRFGEEHVVVHPGDDEGVVSLGHRDGVRDACHAVIDELDPDARSWVRHRLDLEGPPPLSGEPSPRLPGPAATPATDLVARARRSLQDYDYEAAERDLTAAFESSGGGLGAALPLLGLWVDDLGQDREALELEPRLDAEARAHAGVRTHLALAAARCGESERAAALVRDVDAQGAAEVFVVLAHMAVRDHDPGAAKRFVDEARRRDPAHPELPRLSAGTAELEAARHRGAEEALAERWERLGAEAVEQEALELRERWPRSEVAGRILRRLAEKRRCAEIDGLLDLGERAAAAERWTDAALHFQKALDLGAERPGLAERVARLRRRERERVERIRVDTVAACLERAEAPEGGATAEEGEAAAALLAYLALPESLRDQVRRRLDTQRVDTQRVDTQVLGWLEQAAPPSSGKSAQAAVAAVLALRRARTALEVGVAWTSSAADALAELERHQSALRGVPEARSVLSEGRSRQAAARRETARRTLAAACDAFAGGDDARLRGARELLDAVDPADLDEADRARARELRRRIRQAEGRQIRVAEYERLRSAGDLTAALRCAEALGRSAGNGGPWAERQAELRRRIREAWQVDVVRGPSPLSRLHAVTPLLFAERYRVWLDETGDEAVLPSVWDHWLFLHHVDLRRSRRIAGVSLRTPRPLGRLQASFVDGGRMWLVGSQGHVAELELGTWDVLSWRSLADLLAFDADVSSVAVLPDAGYLWFQAEPPGGKSATWVVELDAWRLVRKIPSQPYMKPILGPDEPRMVGTDGLVAPGGCWLYTPRGVRVEHVDLQESGRLVSAAVAPDARGLVGIVNKAGPDGWEIPGAALVHLEPATGGDGGDLGGFEVTARHELPDPNPLIWQSLMTCLTTGRIFVRILTRGPDCLLLTFERTTSGFAERSRQKVPLDCVLLQDRRSRHVAVLSAGDRAVEVLDPSRPDDSGRPHRASRMPILDKEYDLCAPHSRARSLRDLRDNVVALRTLRGRARHAHLGKLRAARSREEVCQFLANALNTRHFEDTLPEYRRFLQGLPERSSTLLLAAGHREAEARAREYLDGVDPDDLSDREARHYYHLLGLDELRRGERDSALATFRRGLERELGDCCLEALVDLLTPMPEPPDAADWAPERPVPRQILGAILTADQALAAGDAEKARTGLERPAFWQAESLQAAARLAAAWLRLETPSASERLAKRLALACFCHLHSPPCPPVREETQLLDEPWCQELLFAGLVWDLGRLDEVASRARAWLKA